MIDTSTTACFIRLRETEVHSPSEEAELQYEYAAWGDVAGPSGKVSTMKGMRPRLAAMHTQHSRISLDMPVIYHRLAAQLQTAASIFQFHRFLLYSAMIMGEDQLFRSCEQFSTYPKNVLPIGTFFHSLQTLHKRLDDREDTLFCTEDAAALYLQDYEDGL